MYFVTLKYADKNVFIFIAGPVRSNISRLSFIHLVECKVKVAKFQTELIDRKIKHSFFAHVYSSH